MDDDRLKRHDLSDADWVRLEPLLPGPPRQGCPWRDLPERFGNWKAVYNRHRRWSGDGTWEKILDRLRAGCDEAEGKAWMVAADATVVRAPPACRRCPSRPAQRHRPRPAGGG